jgi:dTDP-glucose 4,6-dehydratase
MKTLLVTGGAGFIGSNFIVHFLEKYTDYKVVNLDALTYAGDLSNLTEVEGHARYIFEKGDICDRAFVENLFSKYQFNGVVHFAAESHVDNSIEGPEAFIRTNVFGTFTLLDVARKAWMEAPFKFKTGFEENRFLHVSTDEVYGSLGEDGLFSESTAYAPNSPYSASKASSDFMVRSYFHTYGLNVVTTNCSNNYGPNHFPEKLIPLFIHNIITKKPLPVYGDGLYTRDWLFVKDHARAIDLVFHQGKREDTYNIGGFNEWTNIDLVKLLCAQMDEKLGRTKGESESLITYVKDRPGHDRRYAIDATKLNKELGWSPSVTFEQGLAETIDWYLNNEEWLTNVTSGAYQQYYNEMYTNR